MFKRFLVLDLFHKPKNGPLDWINANEKLPENHGIYKVRLKNEDEILAYFCHDKCMPLMEYFKGTPSYWWSKSDQSPLHDVTHWGKTK